MDDAENEQDAVVGDEVVHDSVVADAEAVEGVGLAADRLHLFAVDAAGSGLGLGELFEAGAEPFPQRGRQLLEVALSGGREPDFVGPAQAMSRSDFVRPRR